MVRVRSVVVAAALALVSTPLASAGPGPGDDGTHHREGEYGGVSPAGVPSADARPIRPPPGTLGWVGFAAKPDVGEVFPQAAAPFTVTQRVEGGQVVVWIEGLTRQSRTTRRALDTRFFDGPVARIQAKAVRAVRPRKGKPGHPAGVEVRVTFKAGAPVTEATTRTATEQDGLFYTYLTFAGAAPTPAADQ
ncbi:MAG: hypothetical protein R3B06_30140 [Kofleriaceae bacterium]